MADITLQATELKPASCIGQMIAEQIFRQGLGNPVKDDFGSRGTADDNRLNLAQMESSALADLKPAGKPLMHADSVEGANSDNRFVWHDLDFNQNIVASRVPDNLTPEQSSLK